MSRKKNLTLTSGIAFGIFRRTQEEECIYKNELAFFFLCCRGLPKIESSLRQHQHQRFLCPHNCTCWRREKGILLFFFSSKSAFSWRRCQRISEMQPSRTQGEKEDIDRKGEDNFFFWRAPASQKHNRRSCFSLSLSLCLSLFLPPPTHIHLKLTIPSDCRYRGKGNGGKSSFPKKKKLPICSLTRSLS